MPQTVIQYLGITVVYGEAPALVALSIGLWNNYWSESTFDQLIKATVNVLRKDVSENEICIFKTASVDARLVPYFAKMTPDVKHVFMFRKNGLNSVERMVLLDQTTKFLTFTLFYRCPRLCGAISAWAISECKTQRQFRPINTKEWAALIFAFPYSEYLRNRRHYCLPVIWYEELIEEPNIVLKSVFKELGIAEGKIKDALQCLNVDSQKNTFISQNNMKAVRPTEIDEFTRKRLNDMARLLEIPREILN